MQTPPLFDEPTRNSLEILSDLRDRYGEWIRPEIRSARWVQTGERCWLVITISGEIDQTDKEDTYRADLEIIANGFGPNDRIFDAKMSIFSNVQKFLGEFDELAILVHTDLFVPEAAAKLGFA